MRKIQVIDDINEEQNHRTAVWHISV